MEEEEYTKMLDHLQKYVPHLEKLISQLKDPKKKNKELQLSKLEGLLSMITDRKKKLKLDTLKKCEDVILKILQKVHPSVYKQMEQNETRYAPYTKFLCKTPPSEHNPLRETEDMKTARFQLARARLSELSTPASPSPPRDVTIMTPPIVIPTEKVTRKPNPDEFQIKSWENTFEKRSNLNTEVYKTEKPDIYSKAAESLTANLNKKPVFERLGTRVDMSVPPLSVEDLQKLTESDNVSVSQLEHVRDDLKKKLILEEGKSVTDLRIKLNRDRRRDHEKSHSSKAKVEKVIKDPDSKFGNLLSSIDEQILEKQDKKEEKRSKSDKDKHKHKSKKRDKSKERHRSKDHKSKHHDKEKSSERKKDHHKDEKDSERKKDNVKDNKDLERKRDLKVEKDSERKKDNDKVEKDSERKKDHDKVEKDLERKKDNDKMEKESERKKDDKVGKDSERKKDYDKVEKNSERKKDQDKVEKVSDRKKDRDKDSHKMDRDKDSHKIDRDKKEEKPKSRECVEEKAKEEKVFKRLADKYNPRPRKNSVDVMDRPFLDEIKETKELIVPINKEILLKESLLSSINDSLLSNVKEALCTAKEASLNSVLDKRVSSNKSIEPFLSNNKDNEQYLTNVKDTFYPSTPAPDVWTSPNYNVAPQQTLDFIPPPNSLGSMRTGNTYLNTFIVQNNMGNNISNIPHNQFSNPNTFLNQIPQVPPAKVFHPYEPITTPSTYELNKMSPVEYYPQNQRSSYQNQNRSYQSYVSRERMQFTDSRDPRIAARREEVSRPLFNRDPRIRSREEKQIVPKMNFVPPPPLIPPVHKRRSIDETPAYAQTKYDMMYTQTDRGKIKEDTFISPLDSLYSGGGEDNQRTGKGYGVQKFRIPKRRQDFEDCKVEEPPPPPKITEILDTTDENPKVHSKTKAEEIIEDKSAKDVKLDKVEEITEVEKEDKEDKEQGKASQSDQSIIANFLANLIQGSDKKHLFNVLVHSLTGNVNEQQKSKFKRIQKIIDSDSEPENEEEEKTEEPIDVEVEKEKTPEVEEKHSSEKQVVKKTKKKSNGCFK